MVALLSFWFLSNDVAVPAKLFLLSQLSIVTRQAAAWSGLPLLSDKDSMWLSASIFPASLRFFFLYSSQRCFEGAQATQLKRGSRLSYLLALFFLSFFSFSSLSTQLSPFNGQKNMGIVYPNEARWRSVLHKTDYLKIVEKRKEETVVA